MTSRIETHASLEGFFHELIDQALSEERVMLDDGCRTYLLNLCREFSRHEALHGCARAGEAGTPALVWLFERAQTSDRGARFNAYRQLGDVALVVSGFFAQHIERERSLVGMDYYVKMGTAAYHSAAQLAERGFQQILAELARHFRRVVEVLTRVAEQTTLPVAKDAVALYQRLMRTPESGELRQRLLQQGFVPALASGAKS